MPETVYKVQIDDEDHYPPTYTEAHRLFMRGKRNECDCRLWRQVWDKDGCDPIEEDIILTTDE